MKLGDIIRLRTCRSCGSHEWEAVRMGAYIAIKCLKWQRRVLLEKAAFERRMKEFVSKCD